MVAVARKYYSFDRNMAFAEDLTLTATGNVQFGGNDVILDLGDGRNDDTLVINVTALDVASGNELYQFVLLGSTSPTFASDIETLAWAEMGDTSVRTLGASQAADSAAQRLELPFCNRRNDKEYRYLKLRLVAAGTTPSITFDAWVAPASC